VSERLSRWTRNPLGSARRGSNPLGVVFADPKSVWAVLEGRHWCQFAKRWLYLSWWKRIEAKNHGAQHFKVSTQGWRSASRHWHSRLPLSLKRPACRTSVQKLAARGSKIQIVIWQLLVWGALSSKLFRKRLFATCALAEFSLYVFYVCGCVRPQLGSGPAAVHTYEKA
jgi:hypothetical protein